MLSKYQTGVFFCPLEQENENQCKKSEDNVSLLFSLCSLRERVVSYRALQKKNWQQNLGFCQFKNVPFNFIEKVLKGTSCFLLKMVKKEAFAKRPKKRFGQKNVCFCKITNTEAKKKRVK